MFTLRDIRAASPCTSGWARLVTRLGNPPKTTQLSLGDIVISNNVTDAWWCIRVLDWSNINVRRAVIRALLPSVQRASAHTTDQRVHTAIAALLLWANGDDTVDLEAAAEATSAARTAAAKAARTAAAEATSAAEAAAAAAWAAEAAAEAAWTAARTVEDASRAAEVATWAVTAAEVATWATGTATWAASATAAAASERARQATDLITHFPPLIL